MTATNDFTNNPPTIDRKDLARLGLDHPRAYARLAPKSRPISGWQSSDSHISRDSLSLIVGMGYETIEEIEDIIRSGLSVGEIEKYRDVGIERAEDLRWAEKHGISVAVAKEFIKQGVFDFNSMKTMKSTNGIGAGTLAAYQKLDDYSLEGGIRLKQSGVSATTVRACIKVGITEVDAVIKTSRVAKGDDIRLWGIYSDEDAHQLLKIGRNSGDAWRITRAWNLIGVKDAVEILALQGVYVTPEGVGKIQVAMEKIGLDSTTWRDLMDAITTIKSGAVFHLLDAGASVQQINWISSLVWKDPRGFFSKRFSEQHIKMALSVFSVDEMVEIFENNIETPISLLWPQTIPRVMGSTERLDVDRQLMLDCLEFNMSYTTLLSYHLDGFTSTQAAKLNGCGWTSKDAAVAIYGGYSFDEIVDDSEDDELTPVEDDGQVPHQPKSSDEWDW